MRLWPCDGLSYNLKESVETPRFPLCGAIVPDKPRRILVLSTPAHPAVDQVERFAADWDVVRVDSVAAGQSLLHSERFDGVYLDIQDAMTWERVCHLFGVDFFPDEGLMNHSLHTAFIDRQGKVVANIEGNRFTADQLGDLTEAVLDPKERRLP